MIASYLRGQTWEPAPVFDQESIGRARAVRTVTDLREPPERGAEPAEAPRVRRPAVAHLDRYFEAVDTGAAGVETPESLYFVDGDPTSLREVVGYRMRGHPMALMGAFVLPRHRRSSAPNGRPSLASFLSKPPRSVGYDVDPMPPGFITLFLPGVEEEIPAFMERLRREGGCRAHVAADVIDVAFDLRFRNPSEIRSHSHAVARPARSVFRTIAGHVVSGVSVGLHQTLHKDDRFITLADAIQHRPSGDVRLPTIAVNRSILSLQTLLPDGTLDAAVRESMAFHPDTAAADHLLGEPFDR